MKRPCTHLKAPRHSLMAFVLTVVLALAASVMQLLPDITVQSADALSALPTGLDLILLDAGFK